MLNQWVLTGYRSPEFEKPVLVYCNGNIRILEIRVKSPSFEETFKPFAYWDDPNNDGQDIEWASVTHWMPLPEIPKHA